MREGKKDIIGIIEGEDQSVYRSYSEGIENEHVTWHLIGGANTDHESLCGIDANDCVVGTFGTVKPKAGQKVTCAQCANEFFHIKAMNITRRDFE